jgi:hypothetical protein
LIEALGLSLVVALLTSNFKSDSDEDGFDLILKGFFYSVAGNLFFLLMGWIYSAFM